MSSGLLTTSSVPGSASPRSQGQPPYVASVQPGMRKTLLALALLTAVSSSALTVDEMLARFNKVKEKSRHRHGVVMESYLNVHSELAPSRSGSYEASGFGRTLTLDVHADGTVTGRGAEAGRTFEL